MLHEDVGEVVGQVEGHSVVVAAAAVRQEVVWQCPHHRSLERNQTTETADAQAQNLVGQGAVRIEEVGVEVVVIVVAAPVPLADFVELETARVVRVRAGKVCVAPAPRQARLHRHWASLSKQEERLQVLRRRLKGSEVSHRLSRVYWIVERGQVS